jgi:uncharacterized BrkB/YihY/UPF0761 family membrane protein
VPPLLQRLQEFLPVSRREIGPILKYWMETEVHVYGFSIAANVLLSFWPFLIATAWLFRYALNWPGGEQAIYLALKDSFAGAPGVFMANNLQGKVQSLVAYEGGLTWLSFGLLLFTANGIFLPLEVALNRAWGVTVNRPFWKNQIVSMVLILVCGALILLSIALPALAADSARGVAAGVEWLGWLIFKAVSVPITILVLFIIYKWLPNRRVPTDLALLGAIVVGLALELLKVINLAIGPWLNSKLHREYYPFNNSATILLWSFFAGLVMLAGSEWAARRAHEIEKRLASLNA